MSQNARTPLKTHGWRLALVASGALLLAGGPMHPSSDASGSVREELATMTADDSWIPGHSIVVLSTILLAVGLWTARRQVTWAPQVQRRLRLAAIAVSLYVVETVFHLAAVVDSDALRDGGSAPVAFTHIGLSIVLYPLAGVGIAAFALAVVRTSRGVRRAVAGLGVVAGTLHTVSVPLTLLLPDVEITPIFAAAAVSLGLWSLMTGVAGAAATPSGDAPAQAELVSAAAR